MHSAAETGGAAWRTLRSNAKTGPVKANGHWGPAAVIAAHGCEAALPLAEGEAALAPGDLRSAKIAVFDTAIARGAASFTQLATAIFFSRARFTSDLFEREVYGRYIDDLTKAFEAAHGQIVHSFYCENVIAAAALTAKEELCVVPPPFRPEGVPLAELLFECQRLATEADRVLVGAERARDLEVTKSLAYGVVVKVLSLLDDARRPPRNVIELHRRELGHALDYYRRAADRYAKLDYFRGMLIGTAISLAIAAGMWTAARLTPGFDLGGSVFAGCLLAGSVGAVVSVMSRMTFGTLSLDYEAGRSVLTLLGAFRPLIGLVLGAAMWVLIASGLLAVAPPEPDKLPFFRVLTAFLAGFSERWAQDMLGRTAAHLAGRGGVASRGDEPEHTPSRKTAGGNR